MSSELDSIYIGSAIKDAPKHTGFVPNLADTEESTPSAFKMFKLFHEDPKLPFGETFAQQATIRNHTKNPLNQAFFSEQNIQYLHDELRYRVNKLSKGEYTIEKQSDEDLKTIMRSYYLQYSMNDPTRVKEELKELNERVLVFSVDRVMVEIKQYLKYRHDILEYPDPISRPINATWLVPNLRNLKPSFK